MDLTGLHHLTAVTADARRNHRFYTRVLGLRLVKRSVNQDDVSAYHLFYADAVGTPGTDLTFFDWNVPPERRGGRSITRVGLRVATPESVEWWARRLVEHGIAADGPVERDGRLTLDFEDPEGLRLSLVQDGGVGDEPEPWEESPVPAEHQLRGLGPVTVTVPDLEPIHDMVTGVLNMRPLRRYPGPDDPDRPVHAYGMGNAGGPHSELHVAVRPELPAARIGAGGVHHVAFRTPTEESYRAWAERLRTLGVPNSGPVDRYYFRSLYLREPNGVLFEIATDGPGFTVDEDPAELGERIALPPSLEPRREAIVAGLEPID